MKFPICYHKEVIKHARYKDWFECVNCHLAMTPKPVGAKLLHAAAAKKVSK